MLTLAYILTAGASTASNSYVNKRIKTTKKTQNCQLTETGRWIQQRHKAIEICLNVKQLPSYFKATKLTSMLLLAMYLIDTKLASMPLLAMYCIATKLTSMLLLATVKRQDSKSHLHRTVW